MAKEHVYTVFKLGRDRWQVIKYHRVVMLEDGQYEVSRTARGEWLCDCPAGINTTCRHREMVHIFTRAHKINTTKMYHYDKREWVED